MVLKLEAVTLPDASMINTMSARRLVQSVAALEKETKKGILSSVRSLHTRMRNLDAI